MGFLWFGFSVLILIFVCSGLKFANFVILVGLVLCCVDLVFRLDGCVWVGIRRSLAKIVDFGSFPYLEVVFSVWVILVF